jgi:hypothetical protein
MEVLENNKSKMTERVTLTSLLQFIKDNTQRYQPKEEIVEEDKPKVKSVSLNKTVNKIKTFEEKLQEALASQSIRFSKFGFDNVFIVNQSVNTFLNSLTFFFSTFSITPEMINSGHKRFIQYGGFTDFGYSKIKWNKKTILKSIDDNLIDEYYIKSISDYLHINIFILNTTSKTLELFSDYYPNRKHYVIYKVDDQYYPIFNKDTLYFNVNSEFIQKLKPENLNEKIKSEPLDIYGQLKLPEFLPEIKLDESLIPQADLQSVINGFDDYDSEEEGNAEENNAEENNVEENNVEENNVEENNVEENNNEESSKSKTNKIDYSKLSYKELQDLAKKRGISIKVDGKLLTKDKLMQQL